MNFVPPLYDIVALVLLDWTLNTCREWTRLIRLPLSTHDIAPLNADHCLSQSTKLSGADSIHKNRIPNFPFVYQSISTPLFATRTLDHPRYLTHVQRKQPIPQSKIATCRFASGFLFEFGTWETRADPNAIGEYARRRQRVPEDRIYKL